MINEKEIKKTKEFRYVYKNRDEKGIILTYLIMNLDRPDLKGFIEAEFNTLKEVNKYLKEKPL
jgi:hypothetical protein